jgi:hypothetical protein
MGSIGRSSSMRDRDWSSGGASSPSARHTDTDAGTEGLSSAQMMLRTMEAEKRRHRLRRRCVPCRPASFALGRRHGGGRVPVAAPVRPSAPAAPPGDAPTAPASSARPIVAVHRRCQCPVPAAPAAPAGDAPACAAPASARRVVAVPPAGLGCRHGGGRAPAAAPGPAAPAATAAGAAGALDRQRLWCRWPAQHTGAACVHGPGSCAVAPAVAVADTTASPAHRRCLRVQLDLPLQLSPAQC